MCRVSCSPISSPLIGRKYECYVVIEVIDVDELDKGNLTAAVENKTDNGRLSSAVPQSDLTDTDTWTATDTMNIETNIEPNIKPQSTILNTILSPNWPQY